MDSTCVNILDIHFCTACVLLQCVLLFSCVCVQGISVVEQEQLDNMMIEMDGTENKCELEQLAINNNQIIRVHSHEVTHTMKNVLTGATFVTQGQ